MRQTNGGHPHPKTAAASTTPTAESVKPVKTETPKGNAGK